MLLQPGDDGLWHAKLGDFGLARVLRSSLTHTRAFAGTFEYAAPELAAGDPETAATDLYAIGIVLYELLCGVTPSTRSTSHHATLLVSIGQRPSLQLRVEPYVRARADQAATGSGR